MPYALRTFGPPFLFNNTSGYMVLIGNQPVEIIAGTLLFTLSVGRRGTATFSVYVNTGVHFQQYQQISIYDKFNNLAFSGYVTIPKEQQMGFQSSLVVTITAIDQHYLADKRVYSGSYTNATCGVIVQNILSTVLAQEGVTVGQIYDGLLPSPTLYPSTTLYPGGNIGTIPQATFVYGKVSDVLDSLVTSASSSGVLYYWMIDQYKQLWFAPYGTVVGTPVDGTQVELVKNPPTVQRQNPTYRNTQYVMGGTATTLQQTETRLGDGNTRSWTMGYALASNPSITVGGVAQTINLKGGATAAFYYAIGDPIITQDSGQAVLTSANTLQVIYVGQYPSTVISANNAQVAYQASIDGTSGINEDVQVDATLTSVGNALSLASQLLTRYATQGILAIFTTLVYGYAPGQLINVDMEGYGINTTDMLIESVLASDQTDGINIWYTITAVVGPSDVSWVQFFSRLLKQQTVANNVNVGVSQSVQLLASFTASYTLSLTLNVTPYACPLPSATLFPSTTLFPC